MVAEEKQIAKPACVSPEEYLVRERAAFEKSEYLEGEIRPMPGGSREHSRIKENVSATIGIHLR